jgi:hypothetical protein
MNFKQILAKLKAYPLALSLFGVAVLLAGWAYYRDTGALQDVSAALDQATQDNDRYNSNVAAGEKIDDHLAELAADGKQFNDALINTTAVVFNQQYFYDIGAQAGVTLVNPTQGATEPNKDPTRPSVTTFTLNATGHWNNIVSFVYGLQSGPHLMRFSRFHLVKSQQSRSATNASDTNELDLTLVVEVLGK